MSATYHTILAQAAPAPGDGTPGAPQPNILSGLVPFLFIAIIFYFLIIRPQQRRAREHANLISEVKTGDNVVTSSGIHGLIANVKEKTFILKVADNVKIEIEKSAIASVDKASQS